MNTLRSSTPAGEQIDALREAMIQELRQVGAIRSDRVADAFRSVPRHLFIPEAPLETAYAADCGVVTKRDENGIAISSVSAAHIQATMLEQAQIEPGMRVLEVGTGGYNAALIAELVGEAGEVTTVDIDPVIVERARTFLPAAGYNEVNVVMADAEAGVPTHAPFDRLIVTVGAWDIPPAWLDQLAEGGRIVVPFRINGMTRSVAFERDGDRLRSLDYRLCGFVPMQGIGAHTERLVPIDGDEIGLRIDVEKPIDVDGLRKALFSQRVERWSGIVFDQPDELELWLGTAPSKLGFLTATKDPIERGLVAPSTVRGVPTIVRGGSLAYRTKQPIDGTNDFELGVYAHGPEAESLAEEYMNLIQVWDRNHRRGAQARIEVYPAGSAAAELPAERVSAKKHTMVAISWPGPQTS